MKVEEPASGNPNAFARPIRDYNGTTHARQLFVLNPHPANPPQVEAGVGIIRALVFAVTVPGQVL